MQRRACHAANLAQARGKPPTTRLVARFQRRYDALAAPGLAFCEALPISQLRAERLANEVGPGQLPER